MAQMNAEKPAVFGRGPVPAPSASIGAPPLPHEHGAWVMLYAPLAVALTATGPVDGGKAALLTLAVTAAFLAREPADLLLRGRGKPGTPFWLGVYASVAAAAGAPVMASRPALLLVAAIAAVLFAVHAVLLRWPSRRRMDRSEGGEVIAVLGLTLTAPAAVVLSTGRLDGLALCLWAACALYFGGSVFHVKMLLSGAKHKAVMDAPARLRLGRWNLAYHAGVLAIALALAPKAGPTGALLLVLAYAPAILRSIWGTATLSKRLPPLKRVGLLETANALWFAAFFTAALKGSL